MSHRYWTKSEEELLCKLWRGDGLFAREIALIFQRPVKQVYNKARAMALRRPASLSSKGGKIGSRYEAARAHQFTKGGTPANKGKKMAPETYAKVFRTRFASLCKKLGIQYKSVHSLRHTYASRLIKAKVDIRTTAELLGHSDVQTTLNTYAHSDDATKRAAAKKIFV